ncbi:MAG: DUF86 domain-containing protein [Armatimonadota bacterium]
MPRDLDSLIDILQASRRAVEFVGDKSLHAFIDDVQCHFAVVRAIEIIGEAANRVGDDFKSEHPYLPWRDMISMRNRLIHGYDSVDLVLLWDTVVKDIPKLIESIEPLVPAE